MHSEYMEWTMDALFRTKKCLLKTLDYINDNKGRNDGKSYTSSQLDDVEHIVKNIHCIMEICKHYNTDTTKASIPKIPHSM